LTNRLFASLDRDYIIVTEVYGAKIKKIKKKHLYKAYLLVKEQFLKEIETSTDVIEQSKKRILLQDISLKMQELETVKTKELERSLKDEHSVDTIIQKLGF